MEVGVAVGIGAGVDVGVGSLPPHAASSTKTNIADPVNTRDPDFKSLSFPSPKTRPSITMHSAQMGCIPRYHIRCLAGAGLLPLTVVDPWAGGLALVRFGSLVEASFIRRLNRFAGIVELNGKEVLVHIANSGRMREMFVEGRRVLLRPAAGDHRKTAFDLALVDLDSILISVDSRLPNQLVYEAFQQGRLPQFAGYQGARREVFYGESRLDLVLEGPAPSCYVETKSVTLVEKDTGLFPDAPTVRGVKHMVSLSKAVASGHRAAVVFVIQRGDAVDFAPNDKADPEFGAALREAADKGVEVYAYRCRVTTEEIVLSDLVPTRL